MQESKSCALPLGDSPTMIVATATGWIQGFEPWASRATIWRANQLRYTHHRDVIVPFRALTSLAGTRMCSKGFEPPTHGLEGRCSIQLSYEHISVCYLHQRTDEAYCNLSDIICQQFCINFLKNKYKIQVTRRGDRIRTCDPLIPNQVH